MYKNTSRKGKRTTYSPILRENGNGTKNTCKNQHPQRNEKKEGIERKKDAGSVDKTKQNKRNTRERQHEIRLEDISLCHLWLINYGEYTSTSPLTLENSVVLTSLSGLFLLVRKRT